MSIKLKATHGVACALGTDFFGYFGWPSVARMNDGTLVAVASGLRNAHVCPYGRTAILISRDDGETWSSPRIVNDTPFDDRDAGVVALDGRRILVSWFTSDNRDLMTERIEDPENTDAIQGWRSGMAWMSDESSNRFCGAWVRQSDDGGETWQPPVRVLVNTPHGPIRLANGKLLYFGKEFGMNPAERGQIAGRIMAIESDDDGVTWDNLGDVPIYPGSDFRNYHEPHVVELPDGRLIGHIRTQNHSGKEVTALGIETFSIMQSESNDGGKTWTEMHHLGFHGSPPHLLRHSSGTLVCTYGYRKAPFGQRVALSYDSGGSWEHDFVIRDDGPGSDLGYPGSVELEDGSIFSLYYQKVKEGDRCGLLWSRWDLP